MSENYISRRKMTRNKKILILGNNAKDFIQFLFG